MSYPIPQFRIKNWQIPKYRVQKQLNTETEINMFYIFFPMLLCARGLPLLVQQTVEPVKSDLAPRSEQSFQFSPGGTESLIIP